MSKPQIMDWVSQGPCHLLCEGKTPSSHLHHTSLSESHVWGPGVAAAMAAVLVAG